MDLHHVRRGSGPPLLLVHGLGASWRTWSLVLDALAAEREVVAVDLPGHGDSPPLAGRPTPAALTDAVEAFAAAHGLAGADRVGSSLGGRIVLELARRGATGTTIALDPGGFWNDRERTWFRVTLGPSIRLVRALRPVLGPLTATAAGRAALLAQLTARPAHLPAELARIELESIADTPAVGPVYDELVASPTQEGTPRTAGPVTIVWGRRDGLTLPRQARRAQARFGGSELVWLERCGHFPQWDQPEETVRIVLARTAAAAG